NETIENRHSILSTFSPEIFRKAFLEGAVSAHRYFGIFGIFTAVATETKHRKFSVMTTVSFDYGTVRTAPSDTASFMSSQINTEPHEDEFYIYSKDIFLS